MRLTMRDEGNIYMWEWDENVNENGNGHDYELIKTKLNMHALLPPSILDHNFNLSFDKGTTFFFWGLLL